MGGSNLATKCSRNMTRHQVSQLVNELSEELRSLRFNQLILCYKQNIQYKNISNLLISLSLENCKTVQVPRHMKNAMMVSSQQLKEKMVECQTCVEESKHEEERFSIEFMQTTIHSKNINKHTLTTNLIYFLFLGQKIPSGLFVNLPRK